MLGPDELDLTRLPIPTWKPGKDAGPYLMPLWVTEDPDNGVRIGHSPRANIKLSSCPTVRSTGPCRDGIEQQKRFGIQATVALIAAGLFSRAIRDIRLRYNRRAF